MKVFFVFLVVAFASTAHAQQVWSLDSCIRHALDANISVKQAELNLEVGEINALQAKGGMLPNLNAQGSHGYNWGQRIDPFTNQFASERIQSNSFGIASSMTLFGGFTQWNSVKKAEIDRQVAMWNVEKMKNDVALNVATAFLNLVVQKEVLAIAQNNLNLTDKQVVRISKLVEVGQLAQSNLNDILAQQASDQANLIRSENNVYLAKLSLTQLLMLTPEQAANFDVSIPDLESMESQQIISNVDAIVQAALNSFPEIKSAEASVVSAEYGYRIAQGSAMPTLTASYSYGSGYSGASKVLTGTADSISYPIGQVFGTGQYVVSFEQPYYTSDDYSTKSFSDQMRDNVNKSLFFNLNIPIFNGFANYGNIRKAQINALNANFNLEQSKLNLTQSVERAYADAQASLANYRASQLALDASQKSFEWVEKRYEQGASNLFEYSDARTRLDNANATVLQNKYDFIFKLKVLDFYLGKPISLQP